MGELIARGRDGDIYAYAPGLVLRKTRDGRSIEREARIMAYARDHGYPVPDVHEVRANGSEIVMERIEQRVKTGGNQVGNPALISQLEVLNCFFAVACAHRRVRQIEFPNEAARSGAPPRRCSAASAVSAGTCVGSISRTGWARSRSRCSSSRAGTTGPVPSKPLSAWPSSSHAPTSTC